MNVICDTGPLIYLAAVDQFDLLRFYFSELKIPLAVYQEILDTGQQRSGSSETDMGIQVGWIQVVMDQNERLINSFIERGMTYTDACILTLAQETPNSLLLSDDLDIRTRALSERLKTIGTIGILIEGKRDGYIDSLKVLLDRLIERGFHLNPNGELYRDVLHLSEEL